MSSTAITTIEVQTLGEAMELSDKLSLSTLIPAALQKKQADVLIILMAGREMGLSPIQSLRGINVIEGKISMSSELMVAQCLRRPDICERFEVIESTAERAVYETQRKGVKAQRYTFTTEDAKRAELTGRTNWKRYPAAMLRARCAAALARQVYPDLLFGVYDPDELQVVSSESGAPALVKPEAIEGELVTAPSTTTSTTATTSTRDMSPDSEYMVGELGFAIDGAMTDDALKALVTRIKELNHANQEALRPRYVARAAALKAIAAPAPAPASEPA